jgi:hypothetical protein
MTRRLGLVVLAALGLAGCGGSGSGPAVNVPAVAPARVYTLGAFTPSAAVPARRPVSVSFTVRLPNGRPLTHYRTGAGPHTGVHLILVRDDLHYIIHQHPPIGPDGVLHQTVTFPAPGPYRVIVDVYPQQSNGPANFVLTHSLTVSGAYHPAPLPASRSSATVHGYHIVMAPHPPLHAIQAQFVDVRITDPAGRPVRFVPWFGALAHAIFFHAGTLDYFHTHVCAPGAANCSTFLGGSRVSGSSTRPGRLTLGVLLPVPGTWELFLQMKLGGTVISAPFTLRASA